MFPPGTDVTFVTFNAFVAALPNKLPVDLRCNSIVWTFFNFPRDEAGTYVSDWDFDTPPKDCEGEEFWDSESDSVGILNLKPFMKIMGG